MTATKRPAATPTEKNTTDMTAFPRPVRRLAAPLSALLFAVLAVAACTKDDVDVDGLTNFPPAILAATPTDGGSVVASGFTLRVMFADGTTSPLASGAIALFDADGNEVYAETKALAGTSDSIVVASAAISPDPLPLGEYRLEVSATDVDGQTSEETIGFTISALPFPANIERLFIAGSFNGWSADSAELYEQYRFDLVAANTWEIRGIDVDGGAFKFKNTFDWTDLDWGDGDCDGFMTSNADGNADTDCGFSGEAVIRFNDQTLAYTVDPLVSTAQNLDGLYLLGTFGGVTNTLGEGDEYAFSLVGDNAWRLEGITLRSGDRFKFAEMSNFGGDNFGDDDGDGVAELFGAAIALDDTFADGVYDVTFDDATLAYGFEFVRDAGFRSIGFLGTATPNGFDSDIDMDDADGDGVYELTIELTDGEGKFRADDAWDVSWGAEDFPTGIGLLGGPNIPIVAGEYDITFEPATGAYDFQPAGPGFTSIGILGTAAPSGFDTDYDLTLDDATGLYRIVIGLTDGEVKFRADDAWDVNWGATEFPSGTGTQDGPNIPVTAGLYLVTFDPATGAYDFLPSTLGIIGDATPAGWDSDTDLTFDAADANALTLTLDLTGGEAKFRLNDDWAINWGATDFPSGTGTQDGPNIPVAAGTYTVTFNPLTGAYTFD